MRLSIAIPEAQILAAPAVLRLIRMAQASDMESDDQGPAYVAHFEDFPQSVDVVRHLIEECRDPYGIRITVDARRVTDPVTFYQTLGCYRESLRAPDPVAHCRQQSAGTRGCGRRMSRSIVCVPLSVYLFAMCECSERWGRASDFVAVLGNGASGGGGLVSEPPRGKGGGVSH